MKVDAELSDLVFDHKRLVFVILCCLINDTQHISEHQTVSDNKNSSKNVERGDKK